jgi:hypothetical protein
VTVPGLTSSDWRTAGVKLEVFLSNTESRSGKFTADKLQDLAALGLDWVA